MRKATTPLTRADRQPGQQRSVTRCERDRGALDLHTGVMGKFEMQVRSCRAGHVGLRCYARMIDRPSRAGYRYSLAQILIRVPSNWSHTATAPTAPTAICGRNAWPARVSSSAGVPQPAPSL